MRKLLLALVLAGLLPASRAMADTTITLVEVITSPPRTELLKGQLDAFEKANPGVHVKLVSLAWGTAFQKLLSMVQAGDTPDVVEMPDRWLGLYGGNGKLVDMQPYFDKWSDHTQIGQAGDRRRHRRRQAVSDPLWLLRACAAVEHRAVQAGRHCRAARDDAGFL